ncbi:MAG: radical SAM protein [Clostridiales Family XIII bacterium]|jgi:anaerobic ribonucleoside-triphosphate reductase activating protein|nr:radical SAM protein [Clostridiales Family XIII bacterium]
MISIAGIINDSIVDGPGLRLAVFMQGCDKDCEGCHNQEARRMEGGRLYSADEIFAKVKANPLLTGVTLSGGEPLLQAEELLPLASDINRAGLSFAVYTGDTFEQIIARSIPAQFELLSYADTLIDGPFILAQKSLTLPFRGSANQRILDLRASLKAGKAVPTTDARWGYEA